MNSILLNAEDETIVDPVVLKHLHQTLKLKIDDKVKVTILNSGVGIGIVRYIDNDKAIITLDTYAQKNLNWFELVVGASRPQTMKKVIEHGTTFGAAHFHLYKATLSEKSYLDSQIYTEEEFTHLSKLGLSQSAIYHQLPKLSKYNYVPYEAFTDKDEKFILNPYEGENFLDVKINFNHRPLLCLGPERGFTKEEVIQFNNNGFKNIKISSSILRVEQAVFASIAQLEMLRRKY